MVSDSDAVGLARSLRREREKWQLEDTNLSVVFVVGVVVVENQICNGRRRHNIISPTDRSRSQMPLALAGMEVQCTVRSWCDESIR